ncbi:hypothetical protein N8J89_18420 [Crossiella sp. CA-258035]|uniref:hypothetical protein n=1 Tax=Crossiella sp. CA-258035 TaxID=2981138 RepID=UPI0024BCDB11|nr:hypothetical protein [Crossiella sp. CA-258035]WHT22967.1 hypothetical protein N8J89_18420 [Crossiella sp. CA-258035]
MFRREPAGPVCPDCAGVQLSCRCPTCGAMGRLLRGHCLSCTASRDLVEMFTQPDGQPASALAPVAELLAHYDNPHSLILYLRRPGGQPIRRIVTGELACSHETLDACSDHGSAASARVARARRDPATREEELAQFTRDIHHCSARVTSRQDRTILGRKPGTTDPGGVPGANYVTTMTVPCQQAGASRGRVIDKGFVRLVVF